MGIEGSSFHMGGFHRVEHWPASTLPPVASGEGGGRRGVFSIQPELKMQLPNINLDPVTSLLVVCQSTSIRVGFSSIRNDAKCDLCPRVLWAVMSRWGEGGLTASQAEFTWEREREAIHLKAKLSHLKLCPQFIVVHFAVDDVGKCKSRKSVEGSSGIFHPCPSSSYCYTISF